MAACLTWQTSTSGAVARSHSPPPKAKLTLSKAGSRRPSRMCRVKCLASPSTSRNTLSDQAGVHEKLGVRLLRILEDLIGEAALHHPAVVHDDGAAGEETDDAQV